MARGHLTPDADFIFGYEQLATYFYVNVAPEFQIINAGNWIRVENLARNLANRFSSDLLTFTGYLDTLHLKNPITNDYVPIYLDDAELIEAPMWFYKILMHPQLQQDLVMITLNNPFAENANDLEFCSNVCMQYGLNSTYYADASKGYTFCCTLQDFRNSIVSLPTYDLPEGWNFKV